MTPVTAQRPNPVPAVSLPAEETTSSAGGW
jgi:hypothetical protein